MNLSVSDLAAIAAAAGRVGGIAQHRIETFQALTINLMRWADENTLEPERIRVLALDRADGGCRLRAFGSDVFVDYVKTKATVRPGLMYAWYEPGGLSHRERRRLRRLIRDVTGTVICTAYELLAHPLVLEAAYFAEGLFDSTFDLVPLKEAGDSIQAQAWAAFHNYVTVRNTTLPTGDYSKS